MFQIDEELKKLPKIKKYLAEYYNCTEEEICVGDYIPKEEYAKWEYLKGAKKEKRIQKSTGYEYHYSEGPITYPDALDRASRTIITGEGGKTKWVKKFILMVYDLES